MKTLTPADYDAIRERLKALPKTGRVKVDMDDDAVWLAWNAQATQMNIPIYTKTVVGGFEVWRRP